jgi:apolipoprotein N-acyltransferase
VPNLFKRRFAAQAPPPDSKLSDSYAEKLVKFIPADILAAYLAISGITASNDPPLWLTWGVFGALLALTPLYVCLVKTDPPGIAWSKTFHWVTACLAFSAWVFAMGGPFAVTFAWYKPYLGSVVLILTTLIIPVLEGQFYQSGPPIVPPAEALVVPPTLPVITSAAEQLESPNTQPEKEGMT